MKNFFPTAMIAMSEGVDSAVAALLMKQAGFAVTGVTMKLFCDGDAIPTADGGFAPVPDERVKDEMAGQTLKWGILSLAFSLSGCLSLLGFIFSFTARRRAREYRRVTGDLEGRARVGHILSWVGFGVGLGYTVFLILYFSILLLAAVIAISVGGV
jgi:hypothetical protein